MTLLRDLARAKVAFQARALETILTQGKPMKSDIIDIEIHIHHATDRAVLVSDDGDKDRAVWLPLSQMEIDVNPGGTGTITLPEWMARERELI